MPTSTPPRGENHRLASLITRSLVSSAQPRSQLNRTKSQETHPNDSDVMPNPIDTTRPTISLHAANTFAKALPLRLLMAPSNLGCASSLDRAFNQACYKATKATESPAELPLAQLCNARQRLQCLLSSYALVLTTSSSPPLTFGTLALGVSVSEVADGDAVASLSLASLPPLPFLRFLDMSCDTSTPCAFSRPSCFGARFSKSLPVAEVAPGVPGVPGTSAGPASSSSSSNPGQRGNRPMLG